MPFQFDSTPTIHQALTLAAEYLDQSQLCFGHGTDNPWDEAVVLLLWALGMEDDPGTHILETNLDHDSALAFQQAINRRVDEKIPAAYITGEAIFCGLKFHVDERVLVPRSPIGELIQKDYHPWLVEQPKTILDLCCGSGCIGLAAAMYSSNTQVTLADLSQDALTVAERNRARHKLEQRVTVCSGDLFSAVAGQRFDLILCNPPYVDREDLSAMPEEYQHEPPMGLGSGEDGLDITRRILRESKDYLSPGGNLILEVGNSWDNLEYAYPQFSFMWLAMESGGEGITILNERELSSGAF